MLRANKTDVTQLYLYQLFPTSVDANVHAGEANVSRMLIVPIPRAFGNYYSFSIFLHSGPFSYQLISRCGLDPN